MAASETPMRLTCSHSVNRMLLQCSSLQSVRSAHVVVSWCSLLLRIHHFLILFYFVYTSHFRTLYILFSRFRLAVTLLLCLFLFLMTGPYISSPHSRRLGPSFLTSTDFSPHMFGAFAARQPGDMPARHPITLRLSIICHCPPFLAARLPSCTSALCILWRVGHGASHGKLQPSLHTPSTRGCSLNRALLSLVCILSCSASRGVYVGLVPHRSYSLGIYQAFVPIARPSPPPSGVSLFPSSTVTI